MEITLETFDNKIVIKENNIEVGFIRFQKMISSIFVQQIKIKDSHQHNGYGTKLVETLLLENKPLYGYVVTEYAADFWRNFDKTIPNDRNLLNDWIENYGTFETN